MSLPTVPYNGTTADGGDIETFNINLWYTTGDVAWVLASTALVWLMIPGVGFFYSGLARRKSALSLIWLSLMSISVVSIQWWLWGYSLTFSKTGGKFIGNFENFALMHVLAQPVVAVPELTYCVFQLMFAAITPALAIGAAAERGRMLPCVVFIFVWATLVYDPIACWTWNPNGWVAQMGGLDFAGGTPVHISSGSAALAYSLMLGKRRGHGTQELNYRPHNVTHVVIGTCFLWFGWFGFNGGSAVGANLRATMACVVTNLAASVGAFTWVLMDYRIEGKWSAIGWCSGAVAGLVAITPGSGFVPAWAAPIFGVCAGIACNYTTKLKFLLGIDDSLDIFAVHAIGGAVGDLLTGVFAADYIAALDGVTKIPGGWINHNWIQVLHQLTDAVTGFSYSFGMTCVILFTMNLIPGLSLRVSEEAEIVGIDDAEIGEFAYDFVERERDYDHLPMGIPTGISEQKLNKIS